MVLSDRPFMLPSWSAMQEGDASGLGVFPRPSGVHPVGLQCAGSEHGLRPNASGFVPPLDCQIEFVRDSHHRLIQLNNAGRAQSAWRRGREVV